MPETTTWPKAILETETILGLESMLGLDIILVIMGPRMILKLTRDIFLTAKITFQFVTFFCSGRVATFGQDRKHFQPSMI